MMMTSIGTQICECDVLREVHHGMTLIPLSRDGPVIDDEDEDASGERHKSAQSSRNEIFADDPWNAMW